jgi:hypothetical protein
MNKTLLLILCDFLLLSLLALTRWEDATPAPPPSASPAPAASAAGGEGAATVEQDMVAVMRLSLEDERARREEVARDLAATESARAEVEQAREQLAQNLAQTSDTLAKTEQAAAALDKTLSASRAAAESERARNAELARELVVREAELARVAAAETAARDRAEKLAVAVGVVEREKEILTEQTVTLRAAVEAERAERQRVQESATQLAAGVGQLAEQSGELAREVREARPINANTLFSEFMERRVSSRFEAARPTFLGQVTRDLPGQTVLVSDGRATVALLHVDDTPFDWRAPSHPDWERLALTLARGSVRERAARVEFTSLDPRVVAVPLTPEQAERLGGKPYLSALEPFKFPEAVLISAGGLGYGELPFKIDPRNPGYVKVDNRLVRRLFGDFSPSRGDLVLSKTGELLGIMVSSDTCALVTNFLPQRSLALGEDLKATPTSATLEAVARRYQALPSGLK